MRHLEDIDLHAFVDDQVGASRRVAIAALLDAAPVDATRVSLWRKQNEQIQNAYGSVANEPVPLWLAVDQIAIDRGRAHPAVSRTAAAVPRQARQPKPTPRPASAPAGSRWPLAIAVVLAFAGGAAAHYAYEAVPAFRDLRVTATAPPEDHAFARAARQAHDTFSTGIDEPAEKTGAGLNAWLERRLSYPVPLPDLRAAGWSLLGGRIAPGVHGPAALLIYDSGSGDRLSLMVERHGDALPDTAERDSQGVLTWRQGRLSYGIVTTRPDAWLDRNGRSLVTAIRGW